MKFGPIPGDLFDTIHKPFEGNPLFPYTDLIHLGRLGNLIHKFLPRDNEGYGISDCLGIHPSNSMYRNVSFENLSYEYWSVQNQTGNFLNKDEPDYGWIVCSFGDMVEGAYSVFNIEIVNLLQNLKFHSPDTHKSRLLLVYDDLKRLEQNVGKLDYIDESRPEGSNRIKKEVFNSINRSIQHLKIQLEAQFEPELGLFQVTKHSNNAVEFSKGMFLDLYSSLRVSEILINDSSDGNKFADYFYSILTDSAFTGGLSIELKQGKTIYYLIGVLVNHCNLNFKRIGGRNDDASLKYNSSFYYNYKYLWQYSREACETAKQIIDSWARRYKLIP
ncbi:MAG: hypothetical protein J0M30_01375 [Chitinophagales bacterium]|nr:hypothetical protein [Chitinophagales bacterium]